MDHGTSPRWAASLRAARDGATLAAHLYIDAAEARAFKVSWFTCTWFGSTGCMPNSFETAVTTATAKATTHGARKSRREYKRWELSRCLEDRSSDPDDPVCKNLEFFIGLRNRIEHRHARRDANLAVAVSGHAHDHGPRLAYSAHRLNPHCLAEYKPARISRVATLRDTRDTRVSSSS